MEKVKSRRQEQMTWEKTFMGPDIAAGGAAQEVLPG
jgi:hypothetical protein